MKQKQENGIKAPPGFNKPDAYIAFIEWLCTPPDLRKAKNIRALAKQLGISRTTIYFWLKHPATIERVNSYMNSMFIIDKLRIFHHLQQNLHRIDAMKMYFMLFDPKKAKQEEKQNKVNIRFPFMKKSHPSLSEITNSEQED